jgi:excisionase family DNA binding protein
MNLNIAEASRYLKVSKDTLRRWEKRGYIAPFRTPSGRRVYQKEQLDNALKVKPQILPKPAKYKGNFIYILFVLFLIIDLVLFLLLRLTK